MFLTRAETLSMLGLVPFEEKKCKVIELINQVYSIPAMLTLHTELDFTN